MGLVYATSVNLDTKDGLINGGTCVLKKIHYLRTDEHDTKNQSILFVDKEIGKSWRQRYARCYGDGIQKIWTPIFAVQKQFPVRNGVLVRTQFPLRQAAASTIHSAQGCTVQQCVIDMNISESKLSNTNL